MIILRSSQQGLSMIFKSFNELLSNMLETVNGILPLLIIAVFYQMTILQLPVQELVEMLFWVFLVIFGITLSL